jgi:hypothetical protein
VQIRKIRVIRVPIVSQPDIILWFFVTPFILDSNPFIYLKKEHAKSTNLRTTPYIAHGVGIPLAAIRFADGASAESE